MEGVYPRSKCKSEADLSSSFLERFQGRIHRVGRGGLHELFFPKSESNTHSVKKGDTKSKSHSLLIKNKGCISLPRIVKTVQMNRRDIPRMQMEGSQLNKQIGRKEKTVRLKLKIEKQANMGGNEIKIN